MLNYVLTAITHVATQLTGRWFEDPGNVGIYPSMASDDIVSKTEFRGLSAVTPEQWTSFLNDEVSRSCCSLYWLRPMVTGGFISIDAISEAAANHFAESEAAGATLVSVHSLEYPQLLRHIARPPLMLTALGNTSLLDQRHIAVIGSRKASYEALRMSVDVGASLVTHGISVVSGGALGCDIAVHEGMLGSTAVAVPAVVVFAGGLSSLFPRSNQKTFTAILERGGLLVSERLWQQGVRPRDFPARNRIVSGMSEIVAVMAAAERSGSMITAHEALEQGRDVYVYLADCCYDDVRFAGSLQLIEDGAQGFSCAEELLEAIIGDYDEMLGMPDNKRTYPCQLHHSIGTLETELTKLQ